MISNVTLRALAVASGLAYGWFAAPAMADGGALRFDETRTTLSGALAFDARARTVTLPLRHGVHLDQGVSQDVYYVILDASDRGVAQDELGVNYAPILANALNTIAVQTVTDENGVLTFPGTVDFGPERRVAGNPDTGFPPLLAEPGSTGDANYTPLITTGDGVVLNAPQVANVTGLHDKVVDIDFDFMTVTLRLTEGVYENKPILYLSTDASDVAAAALEGSTYAPNMNAAPGLASDDRETAARTALVVVVNGQTGLGDPNRQGLSSALFGEGDPINVLSHSVNNRRGAGSGYSPLWDIHPAVWTEFAIVTGQRALLGDKDDVAGLIDDGLLESGGFGPENASLGGLRAGGFIVNCPVVAD